MTIWPNMRKFAARCATSCVIKCIPTKKWQKTLPVLPRLADTTRSDTIDEITQDGTRTLAFFRLGISMRGRLSIDMNHILMEFRQ